MGQKNSNTISIELKVIEDFFIEPDYNPFNFVESHYQSGINEVVDQVYELSLKEPLED